jgi:hypothetical protein
VSESAITNVCKVKNILREYLELPLEKEYKDLLSHALELLDETEEILAKSQ